LEKIEMKKTLVALAALASVTAFAQTMSITGLVDTGYTFTAAATNVNTKGLAASNSATTVLNILGTEDLGGGLTANFRLQLTPDFINGTGVEGTTYNSTTTGTIGTGQEAFLGLSSTQYGTLKMGRVNSNVLDAWGNGSPLVLLLVQVSAQTVISLLVTALLQQTRHNLHQHVSMVLLVTSLPLLMV